MTAQDWISKLSLIRHPEGGYYRETYRSSELIRTGLPSRYCGPRAFSTAIYFLLPGNEVSRFHRIKSDEIWFFHTGSGLVLHCINQKSGYTQIPLGPEVQANETFMAMIPAGSWFGATVNDAYSFSLVSCTVAPGFDFNDFELGCRDNLLAEFPLNREIILRLTNEV